MSRSQRGFTLVELLIVMVIIGVLVGIAIPASSRIIQSGKASACISNLRNLGVALHLYLGEHGEIMPPNLQAGRQSTTDNVPVIDNTLNVYATDPRVFICPGDNQGIGAASGTSYYWNSVLDGQSVTQLQFFFTNIANVSGGHNSEIPVLCDKQAFHPYTASKVNLLYADGHASQDLNFSISQ